MGRFFNRERFGRPQVLAAFLLLVFLAQCLWLVGKGARPGTVDLEVYRLERGTALWKSRGSALAAEAGGAADLGKQDGVEESGSSLVTALDGTDDAHHSPLWY